MSWLYYDCMEKNSNIEIIIVRYLQNNISEEEMRLLMSWINENKTNKDMFFQIKKIHDLKNTDTYPTNDYMNESWERIANKINSVSGSKRTNRSDSDHLKKKLFISVCKYAAVAIFCIGLTIGVQLWIDKNKQVVYTAISTESGPRMSHLVLPDGTKVVLNASSKFNYSTKYGSSVREVYLDGEAFFDVVKNKKVPFIVKTAKQRIEVLGTTFNVMDYSDDDYAITTLVSGSVKMQTMKKSGEYDESHYLKPSQQAFFNKTTNQITLSSVDIDPTKTWVNKIYHFNNEPLSHILQRLEKIYGVKIAIENEHVRNVRYTGTFELDQPIDNVLNIINYDKQFSCIVKEDKITIQ